KFREPFLCLIEMSRTYTLEEDTYPTFLHDDRKEMGLFSFIQVADPTKVKVGEQEHAKGEARLLDSIVGRVVLLLPVAPTRAECELEASVVRLFDKVAVRTREISPLEKRQATTDASGSSHPPKKLNRDFGTSGEAATNRKSPVVLRELLASSMLNVEAGVAAVETFLMVTSSVSVNLPLVMTEAITTTNVASIPSALASKTDTKETKAAEAVHLRAQVSATEVTEKIHAVKIHALKQQNATLENEKDSLDGRVAELQSSVYVWDLELEGLNVDMSSLRSQKDGFVDQGAISTAIEHGMQSGLTGGIDHGKEEIREVDFPLLVELKCYKYASVEDIMNLLRLEGPLADAPGMSNLQPDVEQLRVLFICSKIRWVMLCKVGHVASYNFILCNMKGTRFSSEGYLESGTSISFLKFLAIKQLAIKRWDEYGSVIHPGLVGVSCKSMRIDL
nr:transposase (putative), gypsy type [Tanacetum cinerariifolium]